MTITVVVPTRDRPAKLASCLAALEEARERCPFDAVVCDSSPGELAAPTEAAVAAYPWARYVAHDLVGPCAARNLGTREATGDVVVYVDDDVYVEPQAIAALADAVEAAPGAVVAGTLDWGDEWSVPMVMRRIGHSRPARPDETPEWCISAVLAVPRATALAVPWDEARRYYDDRFMCLLWRRAGVPLRWCPQARARHDDDRKVYPLAQERHRAYVNTYDAVFLRRSPGWALSFWTLGLAVGLKRFGRTPRGAAGMLAEWLRGSGRFVLDLPRLARAPRA